GKAPHLTSDHPPVAADSSRVVGENPGKRARTRGTDAIAPPRPEAEASGRPPRGGRLRGGASVGGVGVKRTEASPDRSAEATPASLSEGGGQDERPEKARRIARSSSGHTAGGRGFKK